jgi:hypothetical protein
VLYVCSIVRPSKIHGYGCFSAEHVKKGTQVWVFNPEVDHVLEEATFQRKIDEGVAWEWFHAYRSRDGRLILPRDNSCFMNFSEHPSLVEGSILNGEPCLVAAFDLLYGDEFTVGVETDVDSALKFSLF